MRDTVETMNTINKIDDLLNDVQYELTRLGKLVIVPDNNVVNLRQWEQVKKTVMNNLTSF